MKLHRLIAVIPLLAACSDATTPGEPPVFGIVPAAQWSGGEVEVTSGAVDGATLPVIVAGAETLSVRRVGDSTITVRVPLGSSGAVAIALAEGTERTAIGDIQRVGFRTRTEVSPAFYGELVTSVQGGHPVVIGALDDGTGSPGSVQVLDLATMQVTPVPGLFASQHYGVSPTFKPNEYVLTDAQQETGAWQIDPLPAQVDTVLGNQGSFRHLAWLSDKVFLRTTSTLIMTPKLILQGSPWSIFISPRGDLATIAVGGVFEGVPVFDLATGDTAFTLGPGLKNAQWATFSADGSRIFFLTGPNVTFADSLVMVNANNGHIVRSAKLPPAGRGWNMAADPVKRLLFVETLVNELPRVLVYRTTDMVIVGELPVPDAVSPGFGGDGAVSVDRARNTLHVTWDGPTVSGVVSSPDWSFDLLP